MAMVYFIAVLLFEIVASEQITTPPNNAIVFDGEPVELQCAAQFSGTNTITWEFNDVAVYYYQFGEEEYPNNGRNMDFVVEQDGTNFNVVIQKATYSSAGKYSCRLTTSDAFAYIIVLGKPHLTPSVPKPIEGNIAVYTCEARFGGPKKSEVSPDIYPQLRILLDDKLIDGTSHLQEPKNSTKYHILKLVYHTVLEYNMRRKKLTCEIMTINPKVVASTHDTVYVQSSETTPPAESANADSGGSAQVGVAFAVINFLLIVGIIVGVVAYKFVLKKNPSFRKFLGYKPLNQDDPENKDSRLPGTSGEVATGDHDTKKETVPVKGEQKENKEKEKNESKVPKVTQQMATDTTKQPDPTKQSEPTSTLVKNEVDVESNKSQSKWGKAQTEQGPNRQDAEQPTKGPQQSSSNQQNPSHGQDPRQSPHQEQYRSPAGAERDVTLSHPKQTVRPKENMPVTHPGEGSTMNRESDPGMSHKTRAKDDGKSAPEPTVRTRDSGDGKSAVQVQPGQGSSPDKEDKSEVQKAAEEARADASLLRAAAEEAKTKLLADRKVHKDAKKAFKAAKRDKKKAAKDAVVTAYQIKHTSKEAFEKADTKAQEAEKKAAQKEKEADKEAEEKAKKEKRKSK